MLRSQQKWPWVTSSSVDRFHFTIVPNLLNVVHHFFLKYCLKKCDFEITVNVTFYFLRKQPNKFSSVYLRITKIGAFSFSRP